MAAISDKTRKLLWGRSGARCATCKSNLVMSATAADVEAVVGDECHIYARHAGGPRANPNLSEEQVNAYDNLILLCKIHHKLIDDQPNTYTAEYLRALKSRHEAWVSSELQPRKQEANSHIALRVDNGTDILRIVSQAYGYDFQHDELKTEEEVEAVGSFLQDLQDYDDILSEIGGAERVKASFAVSQQMKELDQLGFAVFIGTYIAKYRVSDGMMDFPIVSIRVARKTNPAIQTISEEDIQAAVEKLRKNNPG